VSPRLRAFVLPVVLTLLGILIYSIARFPKNRAFVDFEVYSRAGGRIAGAEPLYREDDGHFQFKYLPAFAFAAVPFAKIDQDAAKAAWFALTFGLIVAFVRRSIRQLPARRMSERSLGWLTALFLGRFFVAELSLGQVNVLFGLLLVLALTALQTDRAGRAGIFTALATFIKPYGVLFFPWLAVVGGIAAVASSGAIMLAGLALPATLYGWSGNAHLLVEWYRTVTGTTPENLRYGQNISMTAMWTKWLGLGTASVALGAATSVALLLVVVWVWSRRSRVAEPLFLECALIMTLEVSRPWQIVTGTTMFVVSFTIFDVVGRRMNDFVAQHALISVGAIVLVVSLAHLRARSLA